MLMMFNTHERNPYLKFIRKQNTLKNTSILQLEEFRVKRFSGIIYLLFVIFMVTSPLVITVEANFVSAQTSTTFSGELLPDPYFTEEPYVEIGGFSPEFSSEYVAAGGSGSVALIWTHTAGHEPMYNYYPLTCEEYARVTQEFDIDYNETFQAVKISASVKIDCTGDFATPGLLDDMWEVNFQVQTPYLTQPVTVSTISELSDGDNEEIDFLFSRLETMSIFHEGGLPGQYALALQLIPTSWFAQIFSYGGSAPWEEYSGSVKLTIDHLSIEAMLEGDSKAPPIRTPKYNTTDPVGETSWIRGIETAGYNSIHQLRQTYNSYNIPEYSLLTFASDHQILRNDSIFQYSENPSPYGIMDFASSNDRIAMIGSYSNMTFYGLYIEYIDSTGNLLWNSTQNLFGQDIPFFVDIDTSGNILVFVLSARIPSGSSDQNDMEIISSIVKLNNQGNRIWNKTILALSYLEYTASGGLLQIPYGFGCSGNNLFIGYDDKVQKYDSNGNQVWSRVHSHLALCIDPQGGFYTFAQKFDSVTELAKWDTNGNIAWTMSLGWDYGSGWIEYPSLSAMEVGPNGPLHLVLRYDGINRCSVLTRVARTGQLLSQDTIFEEKEGIEYWEAYLPLITDIAITGDGLVHIVGTDSYSGGIYNPFFSYPGSFMLTFELPSVTTFNPISITMVGIASVLILGIAYDFFFRRGKVPAPPAEPSVSDFEW